MQLALREMPARRARPASCPKKASRTSGRGPDRKKPYSRTVCRALPCPHLFGRGQRNVSTCCQQSFFGILLNGSILPPPFVLATYPKVSSPRTLRQRQRN